MQPLRVLDAEFLHIEQPSMPMNIGGALVFEGPVPERGALRSFFEEMIAHNRRYRERVQEVPHSMGQLAWLDDSTFSLERHLRWTALPSPRDDVELAALTGRIMSEPLDRSRPLWAAWAVEGLEHGRWALIIKAHHAMLDGVAAAHLLTDLLDHARVRRRATDDFGSRPRVAVDGSAPRSKTTDIARILEGALRDPSRALRDTWAVGVGLKRLADTLTSGPAVSIHGPVGRYRRFAFAHVRLADIERIRNALGGTVNDVVLAVLSGAYRELLSQRGDAVEQGPIRSLVPVSTRRPSASAGLDNRLAAVLCELPTHLPEPLDRLRWVSAHMNKLKHAHTIEGIAGLLRASDYVPPALLAELTKWGARLLGRVQFRSPATITTHVRGSAEPLYCLGRKLLHCYPYVPLVHGIRVATAVLTYDEHVEFGVSSDYESVPELHVLADAIAAQVGGLLELALRMDFSADGRRDDGKQRRATHVQ